MRKTLSAALSCIVGLAFLNSAAWPVEIAGHEFKSESPIQFKVRLGPNDKDPEMLIVLDQSTGGGSYDAAICDDNLDGSLEDEEVVAGEKKHGTPYFTFQAVAPFGRIDPKARYEISLHAHKPQNNRTSVGLTTSVTVKTGEGDWMYSVLHGHPTGRPMPSNIYPLSVGKPIKVDINTSPAGASHVNVRFSIEDRDGQFVRAYRMKNNEPAAVCPRLKVDSSTGKTIFDSALSFG
jgi:hypothetical protein